MKQKSLLAALAALLLVFSSAPAWSQATLAKVEGKITDNGKPLGGVQVVLTSLATGKASKMTTDKGGSYFGVGFTVGDYKLEILSATGERIFETNKVGIAIDDRGNPAVINIDVTKDSTGSSTAPKYTKEQLDAIKAQNAKATNLNALITQYTNAMNAKNWQDAIGPLQGMIEIDPKRWEFYQALGGAQFNVGQYQDCINTFEKALPLVQEATADPKADQAKLKAAVGQMLTTEGNAYIKLGKTSDAVALFTKAAELDPNPGTAYFNLCATQYNAGQMDAAAISCGKAIQADPNKADAYFIKGSAMFGNGKLDANNKYIVPPGTVDALNKYLELAPDGGHATDVKAMLEALGAKIETSFGKKKK